MAKMRPRWHCSERVAASATRCAGATMTGMVTPSFAAETALLTSLRTMLALPASMPCTNSGRRAGTLTESFPRPRLAQRSPRCVPICAGRSRDLAIAGAGLGDGFADHHGHRLRHQRRHSPSLRVGSRATPRADTALPELTAGSAGRPRYRRKPPSGRPAVPRSPVPPTRVGVRGGTACGNHPPSDGLRVRRLLKPRKEIGPWP